MSALELLSYPVFLLDRRRTANKQKRGLFRRQGLDAQFKDPFDVSEIEDRSLTGIQVVSFLKLVAIVAAAVAPFMLVNWLLVSGQIRQSEVSVLDKADQRYVKEDVAKIRREDFTAKIQDQRLRNDEEDARLSRIEIQLQQIEMKIDVLQNQQAHRTEAR